ncbi:MAG: chemotaxis protein CheD [Clostridiales Family XIII bacterium]|jgi:chemotaxis protein CheD|nr:chemotaxis protein CheD [Clostridiales Family XIII bacterium]
MSEQYVVGISDRKVAIAPDSIVTYALGSCVGVALYDVKTRIGGLAHIMLPDSKMLPYAEQGRMKFADTGIEDMVDEMISRGADRGGLKAKIAGGADMFKISDGSRLASIGCRNVASVKSALSRLGIQLVAEDVGRDYGRTLYFDLTTGGVKIQSLGKGTKEI